MNPKLLHFSLEAIQILGILGMVASFPGVSLIPGIGAYAGLASAAATGAVTWIKSNVVGNVPASGSTSPTQTKS